MNNHTTAYIALGSNLGDKADFIAQAVKKLVETDGIEVVRTSEIIRTQPLGKLDQPEYLNAVTEIKTSLTAHELLEKTTEIENSLGRVRDKKWSPRTIDLDILLFGQEIIDSEDLTIPHSQMHLRSFVLKSLCELDDQLLHPVLQEPVSELLARLNGGDFAFDENTPQLVSIAGVIGVGKTTLTNKLSKIFNCESLFEPYDTNPFMPDVYAGKKEVALDSELYFLLSRAAQLNPDMLQAGQICISDYILDKGLIYARRWLNPEQLELYEKIHPQLVPNAVEPTLVIYMKDSTQHYLERIHKRGRPYEQKIESNFLEALDADYEQFFADWKSCPVITLSMPQFNSERSDDIERIAQQIRSYVKI